MFMYEQKHEGRCILQLLFFRLTPAGNKMVLTETRTHSETVVPS